MEVYELVQPVWAKRWILSFFVKDPAYFWAKLSYDSWNGKSKFRDYDFAKLEQP